MGGGAWKVAYADFVTAMMALFMVLWISSQDEEIVFKTVQYFKDPFGVGFSDAKRGSLNDNDDSSGDNVTLNQQEQPKSTMVDLAFLHKLASEYYKKLNIDDGDGSNEKKKIKVNVSSEGLHITIFDESDDPLFEENSSKFTEWGKYMMQNLAWLLDRNPMRVRIDAHTPSGLETDVADYGPWELTVDRANAARRLLDANALMPHKISQVSGFADSKPIPNIPLSSPRNQRLEISLVL